MKEKTNTCKVCHKQFSYKQRGFTIRNTCSNECRLEVSRRLGNTYFNKNV